MCYPVFSVSWFFTCLLKIFRSLMKWPQISHLNRGIKRLKNLQPEREKLSYLNLSSGRLVWIFIFSSRLFLRLEVFEHTLTNLRFLYPHFHANTWYDVLGEPHWRISSHNLRSGMRMRARRCRRGGQSSLHVIFDEELKKFGYKNF